VGEIWSWFSARNCFSFSLEWWSWLDVLLSSDVPLHDQYPHWSTILPVQGFVESSMWNVEPTYPKSTPSKHTHLLGLVFLERWAFFFAPTVCKPKKQMGNKDSWKPWNTQSNCQSCPSPTNKHTLNNSSETTTIHLEQHSYILKPQIKNVHLKEKMEW